MDTLDKIDSDKLDARKHTAKEVDATHATLASHETTSEGILSVKGLEVSFDDFVLMRDVHFTVRRGEVFIIMGGSGCGKSTLLQVLMGLKAPTTGSVHYEGIDFWGGAMSSSQVRQDIMRNVGVLFQSGALWSSMTLAENVALPLKQYTHLSDADIREQAELKLALAGLTGFGDYYPSEISGGMRKRAGLARALALDPEIVLLDEPSAGLDPISARLLDDLILQLRETLQKTFVVVTHELASLFAIADTAMYIDAQTRAVAAIGNPHDLLNNAATPQSVIRFLTRGALV